MIKSNRLRCHPPYSIDMVCNILVSEQCSGAYFVVSVGEVRVRGVARVHGQAHEVVGGGRGGRGGRCGRGGRGGRGLGRARRGRAALAVALPALASALHETNHRIILYPRRFLSVLD